MPREQSLMEQELYDAQHGIFNEDVESEEAEAVTPEDLDELESGLNETERDSDKLMGDIETSAQKAKDNHPDIDSKAANCAEIEGEVKRLDEDHSNLKEDINKTRKNIRDLRKDLKNMQKQQAVEFGASLAAKARNVFFTVGEAAVVSFKKIAELGKEASISLQAATTAAKRTEVANNFNAGFRSFMNEISQARLRAHEQNREELSEHIKYAQRQYKYDKERIDQKVKAKAEKQINSPLHRIGMAFSREGRERLLNPDLDLKMQMEKVKNELKYSVQYDALEVKYNGPGGKITKLQDSYDKENTKVNKAHERAARFMEKLTERREKKDFKDLFVEEKEKITQKTFESKKTGTQVRENDLKDKDKSNGNKTVEKKSTKDDLSR